MTGLAGLPPGRAGRMWLARRLGSARRSADLLDRRLLILRGEQVRSSQRADTTRAVLDRLTVDAEASLLRAAVVAGDDALRPPADSAPALVDIEWSALIGARLPSVARLHMPAQPPHARVPASASVVVAAAAYRDLLEAAVEHAVATGAARVVDDEVATTRFRLRAIEDRWIPRLEGARARLELVLAENESGEAVRLRWAAAHGRGRDRLGKDVT